MKTFSSLRISSAMAPFNASRTVIETISVPSGMSGSSATSIEGESTGPDFTPETGSPSSGSPALFSAFGFSAVSRLEASSPSSAKTAITSLTLTPCAPSSTAILAMTPSSTDSTSMVALSVSISAIISPAETESPSFTSHLARLPSSMVGESAGIKISIAISYASTRISVYSSLSSGNGSAIANSADLPTISRIFLSIDFNSSSVECFSLNKRSLTCSIGSCSARIF